MRLCTALTVAGVILVGALNPVVAAPVAPAGMKASQDQVVEVARRKKHRAMRRGRNRMTQPDFTGSGSSGGMSTSGGTVRGATGGAAGPTPSGVR